MQSDYIIQVMLNDRQYLSDLAIERLDQVTPLTQDWCQRLWVRIPPDMV